jgi:peptidyl-dipeptidase Dcp
MLFSNLCSSATSEELQAVELQMAPILAQHTSKVFTLPGLFERVAAVHAKREALGLSPEQVEPSSLI